MSFGGAPRCATCDKAVYHAEQTIGPGRKIYHKPCLKCQHCGKVLTPGQMVEHDQQPWCKRCHTTVLGTRDLRSANVLPSPGRSTAPAAHGRSSLPRKEPAPPTPEFTAGVARASSSAGTTASRPLPPRPAPKPAGLAGESVGVGLSGSVGASASASASVGTGTNAAPAAGAYDDFVMPRYTARDSGARPATADTTAPDVFSAGGPSALAPDSAICLPSSSPAATTPHTTTDTTTTTIRPDFSPRAARPLPRDTPPASALDARGLLPGPRGMVGSPGGGGDMCDVCGKQVYFAEGITALSRRFHRSCLRCTACRTTLSDPGKVADRAGAAYCRNCYHRLFGPPGLIGR